jgi:hypothetical protein
MKDKWSEECGSDLECDGSWESHLEVQDLSGNSNFVYIVRLSDGLRKKVRVPDVLVRVYGYIEPDDALKNFSLAHQWWTSTSLKLMTTF